MTRQRRARDRRGQHKARPNRGWLYGPGRVRRGAARSTTKRTWWPFHKGRT